MKNKYNIKLFSFLKRNLNVAESDYSVLIFAADEFEWIELKDQDKIQRRVGVAALCERWGSDDLLVGARQENWTDEELERRMLNLKDYYFLHLVEVNKAILLLLKLLNRMGSSKRAFEQQDMAVLRLKALLLLEKSYLDEYFSPIRHLPKDFFVEMLEELSAKINNEGLIGVITQLKTEYVKMYDHWKEAPKLD